nr:MAG TPA: hypothetical protein [Caudoviricetes sp.]
MRKGTFWPWAFIMLRLSSDRPAARVAASRSGRARQSSTW